MEEEGQTDTDRRWQSISIPQRNKRGRPSSGAANGGVNMTLREQEKVRGATGIYFAVAQYLHRL